MLNQWKYLDIKENPADDASRGLNGLGLIGGQRWLQGPGILWKLESEWPPQPLMVSQVPTDDPCVKGTTVASSHVAVVNQSAGTASKLIRYFSDWHRLWTAVAVFLRVLQIRCKERMNVKDEVSRNNNNHADQRKPSITKTVKRKDTEEPCSPLTVQDQVEAELAILKFDQDLAFGKEIPALQELDNENSLDKEKLQKRVKASTKNYSPIQRLDPFLENGILRVGGRLRRADLPQETKHPAILPWKSHVTTLLIRQAHKRLGHAGHGHVISNLREKYWIIKVNTAVRHVISKCVFCRRNYRRPGVQKMADLPKTEESKYTALLIT